MVVTSNVRDDIFSSSLLLSSIVLLERRDFIDFILFCDFWDDGEWSSNVSSVVSDDWVLLRKESKKCSSSLVNLLTMGRDMGEDG